MVVSGTTTVHHLRHIGQDCGIMNVASHLTVWEQEFWEEVGEGTPSCIKVNVRRDRRNSIKRQQHGLTRLRNQQCRLRGCSGFKMEEREVYALFSLYANFELCLYVLYNRGIVVLLERIGGVNDNTVNTSPLLYIWSVLC
mmetsp:Transcript_37509/g.37855  ORF Transcript_37509/g.37855 Transcript_37509/m.37855 type:complete len:140 (-) Transcript_37509:219-638(-)